MAEFLIELVLQVVIEAGVNGLCELFRKPEVKPFIDLHTL